MSASTKPVLRHRVLGPYKDGYYRVAYACDHTRELTVACEVLGRANAKAEAERLDAEQLTREAAVQEERRLCGMRRIVNGW